MIRAVLPEKGTRFSPCEAENLRSTIRSRLDEASSSAVIEAISEKGWFKTSALRAPSERDRAAIVGALVEEGVVSRRRGSRKLGPGGDDLWSEYSYTGPLLTEAQEARADELLRSLDSRIVLSSGYLSRHKGVLIDNEEVLTALDAWLAERGAGTDEVGIRERSYEVFGDEKALTQGAAPRLLALLKFDRSLLRYHGTAPNDFPCRYDATRDGAVVVSENQDMWDSLARLIERGPYELFGERIAGAIFGGGNFARGEGGASLLAFLSQRGIDPGRCVYVGDIDPAGISIQQSIEDSCGIRPWVGMYGAMCASHAAGRGCGRGMEAHAEQAGRLDMARFLSELDPSAAKEAARALSAGARIPQEAVNLRHMEEAAKWIS